MEIELAIPTQADFYAPPLLSHVELLTDSPATFVNENFLLRWPHSDCVLVGCRFDSHAFDYRLWDAVALEEPDTVMQSVIKRRAEFLAGRLCAKAALARLGIDDYQVAIGESREPLFPCEIQGSITHCENYALAGLFPRGKAVALGIDLQTVLDEATLESVTQLVINLDEMQLMQSISSSQRGLFTSLVFSVKESFFKAAFSQVNHYFGFDAVSVVWIDWELGEVYLRLNLTLGEKLPINTLISARWALTHFDQVFTCVELPFELQP